LVTFIDCDSFQVKEPTTGRVFRCVVGKGEYTAPELAGKVQDTAALFLILRKVSGPPFAVKRFASPRFPLDYRIGAADVMMAGSPFEGEVRVSARVSQSGSAGPAQPGDLEGEHAASVQVGAQRVTVTIARVR
jgi:hypothetical protein